MLNYEIYDNCSDIWVVFIHGMGGSTLTWKRQIGAFSDKYNLLLIDLPGHGKSREEGFCGKADADYVSFKIKELLDYLCIKTADFVSLSLGTLVTAHFAVTYPDYVNSLIFGGAVLEINLFYKFLMALTNSVKTLFPHSFIYKTFAQMMLPKKNHAVTRRIFVRESLKMTKSAFGAWVDYLSEIINPKKLLNALKQQDVEMLFISGEEDVCFINGTKKIVAFFKKAHIEIIKKCGHVCTIEKYSEFNERALKFLDRIHSNDTLYLSA